MSDQTPSPGVWRCAWVLSERPCTPDARVPSAPSGTGDEVERKNEDWECRVDHALHGWCFAAFRSTRTDPHLGCGWPDESIAPPAPSSDEADERTIPCGNAHCPVSRHCPDCVYRPAAPPSPVTGDGRPDIKSLPAWQRLDQAVDEWHAAPTADKVGHIMIVAACAAALRDVLAAGPVALAAPAVEVEPDPLAELRKLSDAATEGPWEPYYGIHGDPFVTVVGQTPWGAVTDAPNVPMAGPARVATGPDDYGRANAEFIAAAANFVRDRLAAADRGAPQ